MALHWCESDLKYWPPVYLHTECTQYNFHDIYVLCNSEYQEKKKIVCPEILLLGIEDRCLVAKADL